MTPARFRSEVAERQALEMAEERVDGGRRGCARPRPAREIRPAPRSPGRLAEPAATKSATMTVSASTSPLLTPSSMASLARNGGASAGQRAARSEPIASPVRSRYGAARWASVETRRTVRAHDQSFTSAPRCIVRWIRPARSSHRRRLFVAVAGRPASTRVRVENGETHLPDPMARALPPKSARVAARRVPSVPSRETYARAASCSSPSRLDALGELALQKAVLVDLAEDRGQPSSSSCVPRAAMRPPSSTTSSSASAIVESRWATISASSCPSSPRAGRAGCAPRWSRRPRRWRRRGSGSGDRG